jgi:hypothetical protein
LIEQSASRPKASALASELGVADGFEVGEAVDDQQVGPSVRERHTRTSQVKALPPEVVSVSPARTGFPLARVLRHTASQPAGRFVDWMVQRQTCAISREVSARKEPTPPTTNRDSVTFHSDCIPPPPTSPQVSARRVRPARWRGPKLPGVFRADSAPPDPDYAFPQLTGLRPKALGIAKTTPFRYPH